MKRRFAFAVLVVAAWATAAVGQAVPGLRSQAQQIDLTKTFATRSPWRLVVTQGAQTEDVYGEPAPGDLDICLQKTPGGDCLSGVASQPPGESGGPPLWGPHYILTARPVYPEGPRRPPLFELETGSLLGVNGDRVVATFLFGYNRANDAFNQVYLKVTTRNNNQEVRFVDRGSLRGAMISAVPTGNKPYGYWIEVNRLTPQRNFKQVLRYRSATRYGDGNELAVIDSEMPNIQRRLGLWKPGQSLPLPGGGKACRKPYLKNTELWCE